MPEPLDLDPIKPGPLPDDQPPAVDKPPRRDRSNRNTGNPPGRPPKDKPPVDDDGPKRGRPSVASRRERQYTAQLGRLGVLIFAWNRADGKAFIEGVPRTAKALAAVCEQNPRLGKVLDAGVHAGVWLELTAALGYIAVPIAVNHGKLPPLANALMAGDLTKLVDVTPAPPAPEPVPPADVVTPPATGEAPVNGAGLMDGFAVKP